MKSFREFLQESIDQNLVSLYDELRSSIFIFRDLPASNELQAIKWDSSIPEEVGAYFTAGILSRKLMPSYSSIRFNPSLKNAPIEKLKDIMAHEMVHALVFTKFGEKGEKIGHGPIFWKYARMIPKRTGITIRKFDDA